MGRGWQGGVGGGMRRDEESIEVSGAEEAKPSSLDNQTRETPEYMNIKSLDKVRMAFRIRSKIVNNIKTRQTLKPTSFTNKSHVTCNT